MDQTSVANPLDSDGEFFREEGLTFEDLAVEDRFSVEGAHYRKLTGNTAMMLDLGPDQGLYGTFLLTQPVKRYGNFIAIQLGLYVTRQPSNRFGGSFNPPFARLSIGEVFTLEGSPDFYRKLTLTKAVRLSPSSPLLRKALDSGEGS